MDNKNESVMKELKEVCNKIVGAWHLNDGTQTLIFTFTDQLLKEADLTVINKSEECILTHYTIGILPQIKPTLETVFYFNIGQNSRNKYVITSLTKDRMDVLLHDYYEPTETKFQYIRKTDQDFAEEIIKRINPI